MIIAGAGMVLGNILGGYLADKKEPIVAAIFLLSLMVFSLILVFFYHKIK